jgi:DNA topoisomerase VI subunit B
MNNLPSTTSNAIISSLSRQDQSRIILEMLGRAIIISGVRPSEDEIQIMLMEVVDLVNSRYSGLTINEMAEVVKSGAMADYEEIYLTVRNLTKWLRVYNDKKNERLLRHQKYQHLQNQMPIVERASFFLKNIDKLPSLKKLLENRDNEKI